MPSRNKNNSRNNNNISNISNNNCGQCDSSSTDSTSCQQSSPLCDVKNYTVQTQPCIPLEKQIDIDLQFPLEIKLGQPSCVNCNSCKSLKGVCKVYKTKAIVPVSIPVKALLKPQVQIPVQVVAKTPCSRDTCSTSNNNNNNCQSSQSCD
jgi:hypothetical protein